MYSGSSFVKCVRMRDGSSEIGHVCVMVRPMLSLVSYFSYENGHKFTVHTFIVHL